MATLAIEDVEALVRLLAAATQPDSNQSVADRKRQLMEGLADLVGADVWIWTTSVSNPSVAGDAMTVNLLDGGWRGDAERVALYRFLTEPKTAVPTGRPIMERLAEQRHFTVGDEVIPPSVWDAVSAHYYAIGFKHFLLSIYPLSGQAFSGIGLHRRSHRPPFTERERTIVQVILQQVDWLHRHGTDVPAAEYVLRLTPRQRQIVLFLLSGESLRDVAGKLQLSEHTIRAHVKSIYRQAGVSSRGALLARFMAGDNTP